MLDLLLGYIKVSASEQFCAVADKLIGRYPYKQALISIF